MAADGAPLPADGRGDSPEPLTAARANEPEITARQAFRMPTFWILILAMTARGAAFTTATTHFIPMMVWKGLSQGEASVLLAGFAIMDLPIHFLLGWIADFVNKPKLVAICILIGVIAVLPMLWSDTLWAPWFFTAL